MREAFCAEPESSHINPIWTLAVVEATIFGLFTNLEEISPAALGDGQGLLRIS